MQLVTGHRPYDLDQDVGTAQDRTFTPEPIANDAFDPVPGMGLRHGFLTDDKPQPGPPGSVAVHSSENHVET